MSRRRSPGQLTRDTLAFLPSPVLSPALPVSPLRLYLLSSNCLRPPVVINLEHLQPLNKDKQDMEGDVHLDFTTQ